MSDTKTTSQEEKVLNVTVKFSPKDSAKILKIAESERAPLAFVVRRFVGQCIDKINLEE